MYNLTCMDMEGVHTTTQEKKNLSLFYLIYFFSKCYKYVGIKRIWHVVCKASKLGFVNL